MTTKKIVVLGGYGSFGSLIADQLVNSGAELIVSGRDSNRGQAFADSIRARFVRCDVSNRESLRRTVEGAFLVINATGPYLPAEYSIPKTCVTEKCNYIDLADGREYVKNFNLLDSLAKENSVFACTGASTTPAITTALMDELHKDTDGVSEIKIAMSPGTRNPAGVATFESILSYVGKPITIWRNGKHQDAMGWGEPEMASFADPIGRRRVQLCNIPDLDIFPQRYHADTVTFKAGVEITILNIALGFLGEVRRRLPRLDLPKLTKLLIFGSHFFQPLGTTAGGMQIWVKDLDGKQRSIAVVALANGPRIPTAPAVIIGRKLIHEGVYAHGAFPCVGLINLKETREYLSEFGIEIRRSD